MTNAAARKLISFPAVLASSALGAIVLIGGHVPIAAQDPAAQSANCTKRMPEPVSVIKLPDYAPRAIAPTRDGCFVFVGFVSRQGTPGGSGVSVLRRKGDTFEEVRYVGVPGVPGLFALALTKDH